METTISAQLSEFFAKYPVRQYDKGQIIVFANDDPQYIFYLKKGLIRQYDLSYRGDEIVINVFKPGTFFPMSWAVNNTPNEYFYQASEDCEVSIARPEEVISFVKENPDILFDLLSRVYAGTDGILRRMVHLMGGSAKGRLMYEILVQCRRFGDIKPDASCVVVISENELASRAGLSRETVSREMRKLINDSLLAVSRGKITVHNLDEFESKLGATV